MIVNGATLHGRKPLTPMSPTKERQHGVSWGLGEAGYDVRIKQSVWLFPFRTFRLASTFEYFDMPPDLVGVVHDKSTWARRKLSVLNTVIEPGWRGFLTLELTYHGILPLYIPANAGIAQVLFHQTTDKRYYDGKYQDQENHPVPAIAS